MLRLRFLALLGLGLFMLGPTTRATAQQASSPQQPWPWVYEPDGGISILLMGDTNIQFREEPETAFREVMPTLRAADLRILNLEGPFAGGSDDRDDPDIPHKNWRHSNPDQVAALTAAGIDVVGVANNVTYPWQALMRSLAVLDEAGVAYAGGGEDLEAAHRPVVMEAGGQRIGYLQYAATVFPNNHAASETRPGIAEIKVHTAYQPPHQLDKPGQPPVVITWLDEASAARMTEDVARLSEQVDVVIVSYHWGVSGTREPVSYQTDIARAVIDAGADVVFGHGPHRYQQVDTYRGRPIFYSLAQSVFDDRRSNRDRHFREGLMARITVENGAVTSASLVPTWREDDNQLRLYDPNEGKGRELLGVLLSVNEGGAPLALVGQEIQVTGVGAPSDDILTTDRDRYARGETAVVTLENRSGVSYTFDLCEADLQNHRKSGSFRTAEGGWRERPCDASPQTLAPGATTTARFTIPADTPPGRYRFAFDGRIGEVSQLFATPVVSITR